MCALYCFLPSSLVSVCRVVHESVSRSVYTFLLRIPRVRDRRCIRLIPNCVPALSKFRVTSLRG